MRIFSSVLFLLGLVVTLVYSEKCPDSEEIYPCICDEDDFSDDIIVSCDGEIENLQQLKKALNSLSEKSNVDLDLDDINLGKVPSTFFYGIGITKLSIYHCELDSLTDEDNRPALSGLENTLEELEIVSSFSEENMPAKLRLGHMRKLREVDISFNDITELGNDWFDEGPASLEHLTVSNNAIKKVGDKAFANLINLKYISFDGNVCGDVLERSMLPNPAHRLNTLEVDNNCLTEIPEDGFKALPALKSLSLRTNNIKKLEQRQWQEIWQQLDVIDLRGNPLECDAHMNWIFSLRTTAGIHGTCAGPSEREGLSLREFIESRS